MYNLVAKWIVYKGVHDEISGMAVQRQSRLGGGVCPLSGSHLPIAAAAITADSDLAESPGPQAP